MAVPRNRAVGMQFLPTPSARRATARSHRSPPSVIISTHALREEGDDPDLATRKRGIHISTHALREEGD